MRISINSQPNIFCLDVICFFLQILAFGSASLYLGAFLAREGASFLEENEIFVPSEDDDDD